MSKSPAEKGKKNPHIAMRILVIMKSTILSRT